jgi:Mg2+-importing ATPase
MGEEGGAPAPSEVDFRLVPSTNAATNALTGTAHQIEWAEQIVFLNFFMEFQARHAVEEIRKQVATTAAVVRDGHEQELPVAELVPGDIARLNAGDLVPADARLLEAKDLHVRETVLTGESLPVDKAATDLPAGKHEVGDASSSVFLGTAVQTGTATAVIVCTGRDTAFGEIAQRLAARPPETEFGRGIRHFGLMSCCLCSSCCW